MDPTPVSGWQSIRPWTRRLSLSIREITSVSATFILASPFTKAESEQSLVSLSVIADEYADEDDDESEFSEKKKQAVISDALAKGLSVNVNGLPWQRVLIRIDDKLDEAVIIIYGLMPGRQYDVDLGLAHGGSIRKHVITENSATGSSSPHQENESDVDLTASDSHSSASTSPPDHTLSTAPATVCSQPETCGTGITIEDRLKQLSQSLSLIIADRDSLTASLKSARRDSQKADAALRTEIDILKRASEKHNAAEHRARQKVLALQEAVKRAQSATKEMESLVKEAETELPLLMTGRDEKEREYANVKDEADRVQEERNEETERDRRRIDGLKGELTGLNNKLERLGGKKEKLESTVIPDLEEQLKAIEMEIQQVEAAPFAYRNPPHVDGLSQDDAESNGSGLPGETIQDQVLSSVTHHPSIFHHALQRQLHHSQHLPGAIGRPSPTPIQRPPSLNQQSWTSTRAPHNLRSSLNPQPLNIPRRQFLAKPSTQSQGATTIQPPHLIPPPSVPSSPVLPSAQTSTTQTSTLSSRAPAFEPSLSIAQALRTTPAPTSPVGPSSNFSLAPISVHRPQPTGPSASRTARGGTKWPAASGQRQAL